MTEMSLSCPYKRDEYKDGGAREAYSEELLCSGNDVSDDDGCSQGVDQVFVVGVEDKTADDLAYRRRLDPRPKEK